jgi:hypothetical protein
MAICMVPARECIAALSDAAGVTLHYTRGETQDLGFRV